MSASCWQGQQEISDAISIAGSQLFYSVLAAINFNEERKKMACLVPLFCFSAFWAAHCHPWAVKPLAFPVLNFWKAGGRKNCPGAPVLCAFHGASLGQTDVQLCFTSHSRNRSWVCSPPFLWEAGGGLIPCYRAWRSAFPWRIGVLRGDEAYPCPQIPGAGDGWTMRAPHSGGAVHTQMWERGEHYHTELSWFVHALILSWPACCAGDGGGHVGIVDLYVTPLRWEETREKTCLWHMPEQYIPFGTRNAWPATQPRQDPAEKSCAPVLPQAVELCCTQSQPDFSTQGSE